MSKKVLILSSSPRKNGNSQVLCKQFEAGAKQAGHDVETVWLPEKNIQYCTGCGVCNNTHACVIKDDMESILNSMIGADVIVMATPVYFYSMCAQMKTLIDRTVPRYTEMTNKEYYYILTAADGDKSALTRTLEGFRGFAKDCLPNAHERGIIYGVGAWQIGDIQATKAMDEAFQIGLQV